jgi:hypothetical protein
VRIRGAWLRAASRGGCRSSALVQVLPRAVPTAGITASPSPPPTPQPVTRLAEARKGHGFVCCASGVMERYINVSNVSTIAARIWLGVTPTLAAPVALNCRRPCAGRSKTMASGLEFPRAAPPAQGPAGWSHYRLSASAPTPDASAFTQWGRGRASAASHPAMKWRRDWSGRPCALASKSLQPVPRLPHSDQTKRAPSLSSGMGPGLSARISPVCGSMRRKRLVAKDISTTSPVGVSIH